MMKQIHIILLSCIIGSTISLPFTSKREAGVLDGSKDAISSEQYPKWKRVDPIAAPRPEEGASSGGDGGEPPSAPAAFGGTSASDSQGGTFGSGNGPTVPDAAPPSAPDSALPNPAPHADDGAHGSDSSLSSDLSDLQSSDQLPQSVVYPNPPLAYAYLYTEATAYLKANPLRKDGSIFYDSSVYEKANAFAGKNGRNDIFDAFDFFEPSTDLPTTPDSDDTSEASQDPNLADGDPKWKIYSAVYAEGTSGTAPVMLPPEGVSNPNSFWIRFEWPRLIANGVTVKWISPDIDPTTPDAPGNTKILWQPGDDPNMPFPGNTPIANIGH